MPAINLLTGELAPKGSILKISKFLNTVSILGSILLVATLVVIVSLFFFFSSQISSSEGNQAKLLASIKSMEKVENQYVLVKDRVTKAAEVLASKDSLTETQKAQVFINEVPSDVVISTVVITPDRSQIDIETQNSESLVRTVSALTQSGDYEAIVMSSFDFSPKSGYKVSFMITK